ncbi:hypothetical protein ACMYM5_23140, partial [Salmonella enterica subsp. enterica serovar Enteritidis]|uniref:hypothetical protein n=1 Tax=Salmonella enterica TaxID=28901 RepID=UPI0039E776AF
MKRIADKCKGVFGLTGAPTPNSPTEAFGQAKVVNPTNPYLPRYFTEFQDQVEQQIGPYIWIPKPDATNVVNKVL